MSMFKKMKSKEFTLLHLLLNTTSYTNNSILELVVELSAIIIPFFQNRQIRLLLLLSFYLLKATFDAKYRGAMAATVVARLPLDKELKLFGQIISLGGGEQESEAGGVFEEGGILDGDLATVEKTTKGAVGMGLELVD
ncbi:hypothetical protein COCNU_11G000370 [Cocos nucifera]|uniref:Uncharacterized protein n=1 Tax=Cocos nucifera TaxID=13894 RepID=A0A8K0INE8_COCNU|nr:hypothetical protein COCNU_11G000370 [Cocos nucifera]